MVPKKAEVKENVPVPKKTPVKPAPVETPKKEHVHHTHSVLDPFYSYHRPYNHSSIKLVPCPQYTH